MADLKKLTILHSNDMHGDFLAEEIDDNLVGGVSMLSGYLNKVRAEDPEALYVIAGDMFRGSIIDAEYQGVSTIEIMNYLAPDVVTLGNHEVDYGMAHLLFLEKCCKFPIVNANLYIKTTGMRVFNSHKVLRAAGMNILFIGIITEEIMAAANNYTPSEPFTITVSADPHSYDQEGYVKLFIRSGGADSPRPIVLRQKGEQWFLWQQLLMSAIRTPAAQDPWA